MMTGSHLEILLSVSPRMPGSGPVHPFNNYCRSPVSSTERRPPTPIGKEWAKRRELAATSRENRCLKSPIWPKLARSMEGDVYNSGRADPPSFAIETFRTPYP